MTATSGRNLVGSWLNSGPLGSLERMLLVTSAWASMTCFLTWRDKATPAGRLLFQLAPLTPRTDATAFGLWRSPTVGMVNQARAKDPEYGQRLIDKGQTLTLAAQVLNERLWPTPSASDNRDRGNRQSPAIKRRIEKGKQVMLSMSVDDASGSLNPTWVEWLMGFPEGWTDLKPSEMPLSRKSPK